MKHVRMLQCIALGLCSYLIIGCSPSRTLAPGANLANYDLCVVTKEDSHGYYDETVSGLSRSFIVINANDPALLVPDLRRRACAAKIDVSRGMYIVSGTIELRDADTRMKLISIKKKGGLFYSGARGDVIAAVNDAALARKEAGPLPDRERIDRERTAPSSIKTTSRTKEERLREIEDLRKKELISNEEYSNLRNKIINE